MSMHLLHISPILMDLHFGFSGMMSGVNSRSRVFGESNDVHSDLSRRILHGLAVKISIGAINSRHG